MVVKYIRIPGNVGEVNSVYISISIKNIIYTMCRVSCTWNNSDWCLSICMNSRTVLNLKSGLIEPRMDGGVSCLVCTIIQQPIILDVS